MTTDTNGSAPVEGGKQPAGSPRAEHEELLQALLVERYRRPPGRPTPEPLGSVVRQVTREKPSMPADGSRP
jgi:hypothetical protein